MLSIIRSAFPSQSSAHCASEQVATVIKVLPIVSENENRKYILLNLRRKQLLKVGRSHGPVKEAYIGPTAHEVAGCGVSTVEVQAGTHPFRPAGPLQIKCQAGSKVSILITR